MDYLFVIFALASMGLLFAAVKKLRSGTKDFTRLELLVTEDDRLFRSEARLCLNHATGGPACPRTKWTISAMIASISKR